ncbi:zinc-type alcohol dehydrogenase-like protein [Fistulina hepatica ATCC 64428]|uniref:Zinc-type alcohol dehydrogenase-like protein n=1 Tax=Fistulina hepatica ATCC 64428 TaxID=1128425 RepID=A0A0D7AHA5_9AGAR|nr:zinc-type alcohol dehydrogenase-like protein [Fistulina hepatica ATCC 64428]
MTPSTQKQWTIRGTSGFDDLKFDNNAPIPGIGDHDVLVRLEAASLNYRDLIITKGMYPFAVSFPVVPGSDGAGTVEAVGPQVTRFHPGDKVLTLFNQGHYAGSLDAWSVQTGLGGAIDGTLRQYGVCNENGLALSPKNLAAKEASTLSCAALTAWNALYGIESRQVKPGDVVLTQGTGGVSIFALQFAKAAGATVIATTSSAAKAERLKQLGADHVINYKEDPNWGATAKKLTGGIGVGHVVEIGGPTTMKQSLEAIKIAGIISIVGHVGGSTQEKELSFLSVLSHICIVRGVYVGSRQQLEAMIRAIEANDIHPVVNKEIFALENLKGAYEYMWAQKHFGKLVVKID